MKNIGVQQFSESLLFVLVVLVDQFSLRCLYIPLDTWTENEAISIFYGGFFQLSSFSWRRYERKWCIFAYSLVATNFFGTTSAKCANEPFYIFSKKLHDQNECWSFNTGIDTGDKAVIHMRTRRSLIALTCRISRNL